jgi:Transposase
VVRLAGDLAVVCGGRLRHIVLLFSALFLMPLTQSSLHSWMEDRGAPLPTPEARLRHLGALPPVPECPMDGSSPVGTAHGVMVVKEAPARLLRPHEAASEHGDDARQLRQRCKDRGRKGTAAFADDSPSFTAASKAVDPHARLQADQCHTVKTSWGPLKKSLRSSRRKSKAHGQAPHEAQGMERAKPLWKVRWRLLKKPAPLSLEEQQALAALDSADAGLVQRFRHSMRQRGHSCDHTHRAAQARSRGQQLRQDLNALEDRNREKMLTFFDDHWEHALRYLRKKGLGKHRRGSNAESGMRLLRRLEKNHDGIRSTTTRQHDIQRYQAMKYLSLDIADFLEKGPQMAELPCV